MKNEAEVLNANPTTKVGRFQFFLPIQNIKELFGLYHTGTGLQRDSAFEKSLSEMSLN